MECSAAEEAAGSSVSGQWRGGRVTDRSFDSQRMLASTSLETERENRHSIATSRKTEKAGKLAIESTGLGCQKDGLPERSVARKMGRQKDVLPERVGWQERVGSVGEFNPFASGPETNRLRLADATSIHAVQSVVPQPSKKASSPMEEVAATLLNRILESRSPPASFGTNLVF